MSLVTKASLLLVVQLVRMAIAAEPDLSGVYKCKACMPIRVHKDGTVEQLGSWISKEKLPSLGKLVFVDQGYYKFKFENPKREKEERLVFKHDEKKQTLEPNTVVYEMGPYTRMPDEEVAKLEKRMEAIQSNLLGDWILKKKEIVVISKLSEKPDGSRPYHNDFEERKGKPEEILVTLPPEALPGHIVTEYSVPRNLQGDEYVKEYHKIKEWELKDITFKKDGVLSIRAAQFNFFSSLESRYQVDLMSGEVNIGRSEKQIEFYNSGVLYQAEFADGKMTLTTTSPISIDSAMEKVRVVYVKYRYHFEPKNK